MFETILGEVIKLKRAATKRGKVTSYRLGNAARKESTFLGIMCNLGLGES